MLKKITLSVLVATMLFANGDNNKILENIKQIGIFKSPSLDLNTIINKGSIYQVGGTNKLQNGRVMDIEAFVTTDLQYVILGKGFEAKSGAEMIIPKDMSVYSSKGAFTVGTGNNEYFLFTDPECPYCINLEKDVISKLTEENLKNIKINVFLFPLSFHKNAKSMSYYIMSKKDNQSKINATKEIMIDGNLKYQETKYSTVELEALNKSLDAQKEVVEKLNITGTPTLIDSVGKKVKDYRILFK